MDKKTEVQLMINEDKLIAKMLDTKLDLTIYSDRELEFQVFNTYDLYILTQLNDLQPLIDEIKKRFKYTKKQYQNLLDEINEVIEFQNKLKNVCK